MAFGSYCAKSTRPGRDGASRPKRTMSRSMGAGARDFAPGFAAGGAVRSAASFSTSGSSRLITITARLPKMRPLDST